MAKISSRHVLIVGSAMGLGEMLCQQFEFGNLPVEFLASEDLDWQDQESASKQINKLNPTIVVNALPLELIEANTDQTKTNLNNNQFLIQFCQKKSVTLLQLSSALVFMGGDKKSYDETDIPCPMEPVGRNLVTCEQMLQQQIDNHMLLRFGWLIDAQGDNLFTQTLKQLNDHQTILVDGNVKGAPLWMDDALRVVLSLVRQLLAGSENWGTFHYASADPCTEKEFAQQLIEILEELQPEDDYSVESIALTEQRRISTVLKCRRIRNNFGIHGRTWRQGLKYRIQHWLEGRWLDSGANPKDLLLDSNQNSVKDLSNVGAANS